MQDPWLRAQWNWTATAIVVAFTAGATIVATRFFRWE